VALVVEHHRGTAITRDRLSQRDGTFRLGLEDGIRSRSAAQFVQDAGVVGVETLVQRNRALHRQLNDGIQIPAHRARVPSQNALEPALKEAAEATEHAYGCDRVRVAEQDASGVTAIIRQRDTAERSRYGRST
jgi:hypothetical protein